MESTSVNERWQAEMAEYFVELGGGPPDRAIVPIPEIFHLD
jgi:L-rhamnose mutarotase